MTISLKTHKMLWGRSGNRCAFPDCQRELVIDATQTDDESVIGDEAHIIAKHPKGPRGDHPLADEQRDKYDNLILLCKVHHKVVDDQPETYTVDWLTQMKAAHEAWVRQNLQEYDAERQRDDELYASYVERWADRAGLDNWMGWTSFVLGSGQPSMSLDQHENLKELDTWLHSRVWPKRYAPLECSFGNFGRVLNDLLLTFGQHTEERCEELWTEKFYQIEEWDEVRYERLHQQYKFHVALVMDLMLELTRAANYVCDHVRDFLSPTFRLEEGALLVTSGPYDGLNWRRDRPEYQAEERVACPYPGLDRFKQVRKTRDLRFA